MTKNVFNKKKIIKKLDTLWSQKIRERDRICQKCRRGRATQAAHIFSRSNLATRWLLENGIGLDFYCHLYWAHRNPVEFTLWVQEKIGRRVFQRLETLSRTAWESSKLRDPKEVEKIVKQINASD